MTHERNGSTGTSMSMDGPRTRPYGIVTLSALLAVCAVERVAPGAMGPLLAVFRHDGLNQIDLERQERGYYEHLVDLGQRLDEPKSAAPGNEEQVASFSWLGQAVPDVREVVLKPSFTTLCHGQVWSTNEHGMRDRSYAAAKPPGTIRFALLGDSIAAGWGVADGQGFEPRLERALDGHSRGEGGPAVEILNFATPGAAPGQRWEHFERVASEPFGIDLVICEATPADVGWDVRRLRRLLPRGIGWDAPVYRDALAAAGLRPGADAESIKKRLAQARWKILGGVYRHIAAACRSRGVPCVWVLIPRVARAEDDADRAQLLDLARQAGFTAVLDLSDAYSGLEPESLAVTGNDYHPNSAGHTRLAERLEVAFRDQPGLLRLWRPLAAPGGPRP